MKAIPLDLFSVFSSIDEQLTDADIRATKIAKDAANEQLDLSRGKDNELSKEAFSKVDTQKGRNDVLSLVDGILTTFEIAEKLGKPIHKISGRFTELKKSDDIVFLEKKKVNGATYSVYKKA